MSLHSAPCFRIYHLQVHDAGSEQENLHSTVGRCIQLDGGFAGKWFVNSLLLSECHGSVSLKKVSDRYDCEEWFAMDCAVLLFHLSGSGYHVFKFSEC